MMPPTSFLSKSRTLRGSRSWNPTCRVIFGPVSSPRRAPTGTCICPTAGIFGGSRGGGGLSRATPTPPPIVFSDESAYQPAFGASFTAALPAIKGGGQYIGVSSAEPGEFQQLVEAV